MGNLYFHFPHKQSILKVICKDYVNVLRDQIGEIHGLSKRPEVGFTLDFRLGYITTLEHPRTSQFFAAAQNIPEIHALSLQNKKLRLQTFFGHLLADEEIAFLALAVQGIADEIFDQKRQGNLKEKSSVLSNTIIDFSLRLIGYSRDEINKAIEDVNQEIVRRGIKVDKYFDS